MKDLPEYMKPCYLALFNFVNELGHDILIDHGLDITHYIRQEVWKLVPIRKNSHKNGKFCSNAAVNLSEILCLLQWKKLCASYLTEARWFYNGHTPVLEEYLENAWISVGGPAAIVHAYILQAGSMTEKSLDYCFKQGGELIYWSSLITRLADDLGTSKVCTTQMCN